MLLVSRTFCCIVVSVSHVHTNGLILCVRQLSCCWAVRVQDVLRITPILVVVVVITTDWTRLKFDGAVDFVHPRTNEVL